MKNEIWKIVPSHSVVIFPGEAMKGVEPLSSGLQDRRSVIQLSYIAVEFGGAKRSRTSTSCLQGRHHPVRSQPRELVAEAGVEPAPFRL